MKYPDDINNNFFLDCKMLTFLFLLMNGDSEKYQSQNFINFGPNCSTWQYVVEAEIDISSSLPGSVCVCVWGHLPRH